MTDPSQKRHLAKAISWRVIGTLDTMLLSWIIAGDALLGLKIGLAEVLTKTLLYYIHERVWFKIKIGVSTNRRHIAKTGSWRAIGTLDTIVLAWLISGDPVIGLKVGAVEVVTKMILYFFHEKAWYRSNYGLSHRKNGSNDIVNE